MVVVLDEVFKTRLLLAHAPVHVHYLCVFINVKQCEFNTRHVGFLCACVLDLFTLLEESINLLELEQFAVVKRCTV